MSSDENNLNENSEKAFKFLHDQMMSLMETVTRESHVKAGRIAGELLKIPELPLLYRVRAYIALSHGQDNYL